MFSKLPILNIVVVFLSWILIVLLSNISPPKVEVDRFLAPPPEHIEYFAFGFSDSMADSLWLRWIQDNDVCQTYEGVDAPTKNEVLSTDEKLINPRHRVCDNSWSFKMLDSVTRLAPKFKMPYQAGGITLSVVSEDYIGASIIFKRAIENYPNDWDILYRAAYHFIYDRNELELGARLLNEAAKAGAPAWLSLLSSRIYSKAGQTELGIRTLTDYLETVKDDPKTTAVFQKRISELKEKLATEASGKGP